MRYDVLLNILFDLLREKRVTAPYLAEKYSLSTRTVYRYIRRLATLLPLDITRGRAGGITLADNYRLPVDFLTEAEYVAVEEALANAYAQTANEVFLLATRKLRQASREKNPSACAKLEFGDILFLPATGEEDFAERLHLLQLALSQKRVVRLLYDEDTPARPVEPYALTVRGNEWSLYAFCHREREFRLFPLQEIVGVALTEEYFQPRPSIL